MAKACCDFLTKHVEPANAIGIARFAEEIGCVELHRWCRDYINTHFSEVGKVKSQKRLSVHLLLVNLLILCQQYCAVVS